MNYLKSGTILLGIFLLSSCSKVKNREMTVIRDCTGTYLRLDGKDYQVCNIGTTNDYPEGSLVQASFKTISACDAGPDAICAEYHATEGWIKVIAIEKK